MGVNDKVAKGDGIAPSLLLTCHVPTNPSREVQYLFNLPESLLRLAASHGIHLDKLAAIFIPEHKPDSIGGFCSTFLKKYPSRSGFPPFISPHAFEKISKGYSFLSGVFGRAQGICVNADSKGCVFSDDCVNICAFHNQASHVEVPCWLTNGIINLLSDEDEDESCGECEDVIEISSNSTEEHQEELPHKRKRQCVGKVKVTVKRLKRVSSVGIDSRSTMEVNQFLCFVVHLKLTGELLVIVFLPSKDSLEVLCRHPLWGYIRFPQRKIKAIFHLSSLDLMQTPKYQRWMMSLDGKQIVVNGSLGEGLGLDIGLVKILDRSLRLRAAATRFFPLPYSLVYPGSNKSLLQEESATGRVMEVSLLTEVLQREVDGDLEVLKSPLQEVHPKTFISQLFQFNSLLREMVDNLDKRKLMLEDPWKIYLPRFFQHSIYSSVSCYGNLSSFYPTEKLLKLVPNCLLEMAKKKDPSYFLFLGTGCAEASSWRGSSAILLSLGQDQRFMLLDCGEGTCGQLVRYFGPQKTNQMINQLVCIWVSHQHADHCAGIPGILSLRDPALPPLMIFGPPAVLKWLRKLSEGYQLRFSFADLQSMMHHVDLMKLLEIEKWSSIPVDHSVVSYGLRIQKKNGFVLVYSGDTQPCNDLEFAGVCCTVLIHESTHSIHDVHHARRTRHSTWDEALMSGKRMNAYRTILTHFSRRYRGLPSGLTAKELGNTAAVAFDGMKVKLTDLPFLPSFNSAIEEVLKEIEFGGNLISSDDEDCILSDIE